MGISIMYVIISVSLSSLRPKLYFTPGVRRERAVADLIDERKGKKRLTGTTTTQVIGSVVTILDRQYEEVWRNSNAKKYVGDIAFAGTVVGMLLFGYL